MKPTVGRIVYYYDHYNHIRPSIVTAVHTDETTLDLFVLYPKRSEFIQKVKHDRDHEKETWDWMPYQKEQANKAEEFADSVYKAKEMDEKEIAHGVIKNLRKPLRKPQMRGLK